MGGQEKAFMAVQKRLVLCEQYLRESAKEGSGELAKYSLTITSDEFSAMVHLACLLLFVPPPHQQPLTGLQSSFALRGKDASL